MMGNVIPFPRGTSAPKLEPEPNLPAVPDPLEGEVLPPSRPQPDRKPKRRPRPDWWGFGPRHRAAARSAMWRTLCDAAGRTWWEVRQGIPTRLAHLVRWFLLGLAGALVDIPRWCFAVDERAEIRRSTPRGAPPGRGAQIGSKVDKSWKLRGGFVLVANVGAWLAVWHWVPPPVELFSWITSAKVAWICWSVPWVVGLTVYGWLHDEKPPEPVVAPREREDVNVIAMNDALRSVGVLAKPTASNERPEGCRLAAPQKTTGNSGQETVFDLPASCGKFAGDVIAQRDRLAAAFATPRERFVIEPGSHEAQFSVWTSNRDPFAGPYAEHPLMRVSEWSVWDRYPFAHDVRGNPVTISLVYTSILIGSRPRRGKSFAARSMLVGAVLDPRVRFHVFNGKGGATWHGIEPFSDRYVTGGDDDRVAEVAEALEGLVAEMRRRSDRIPEDKVTREDTASAEVNAPITVVIVDEAQEYLEHEKHGKRIEKSLMTLGKVGPSSGFVLIVITQRPDSDSFKSALKSVFGARLALEVMTYDDSNVILGRDMSKLGFDASKIKHRGAGIYRPDDDADGEPDADDSVREVRTFDVDKDAWTAVCSAGAELRAGRKPTPIEKAPDDDELLNPTELFERVGRVAPHVFADHGIKDVRGFGRWLTVPYAATLSGGIRVRSRRAVEIALGLHDGALRLAPADRECSDGAKPCNGQCSEQCSEHTTEE